MPLLANITFISHVCTYHSVNNAVLQCITALLAEEFENSICIDVCIMNIEATHVTTYLVIYSLLPYPVYWQPFYWHPGLGEQD